MLVYDNGDVIDLHHRLPELLLRGMKSFVLSTKSWWENNTRLTCLSFWMSQHATDIQLDEIMHGHRHHTGHTSVNSLFTGKNEYI